MWFFNYCPINTYRIVVLNDTFTKLPVCIWFPIVPKIINFGNFAFCAKLCFIAQCISALAHCLNSIWQKILVGLIHTGVTNYTALLKPNMDVWKLWIQSEFVYYLTKFYWPTSITITRKTFASGQQIIWLHIFGLLAPTRIVVEPYSSMWLSISMMTEMHFLL